MIKDFGITHKQATFAYNLVYVSSLKYGLPSTLLSSKQITELQLYAVDKFISAMGIDHSTHRALIYGPTEYRGLGIQHLYTEMMGLKIETLINYIRAGSKLGILFIEDISYVSRNWLLHIRQFLIEINSTIETESVDTTISMTDRPIHHDSIL
jgi:hypothetical protein